MGVRTFLAEDLHEEFGGPVRDEMLLGEIGRAVHQDKQFYDACDFVEVTERGMQRGEEFDGDATSCCFSLLEDPSASRARAGQTDQTMDVLQTRRNEHKKNEADDYGTRVGRKYFRTKKRHNPGSGKYWKE